MNNHNLCDLYIEKDIYVMILSLDLKIDNRYESLCTTVHGIVATAQFKSTLDCTCLYYL